MKLNEYIYHKSQYYDISNPEEVEKWIVDWYKDTFGNIPPLWLADREDAVVV